MCEILPSPKWAFIFKWRSYTMNGCLYTFSQEEAHTSTCTDSGPQLSVTIPKVVRCHLIMNTIKYLKKKLLWFSFLLSIRDNLIFSWVTIGCCLIYWTINCSVFFNFLTENYYTVLMLSLCLFQKDFPSVWMGNRVEHNKTSQEFSSPNSRL